MKDVRQGPHICMHIWRVVAGRSDQHAYACMRGGSSEACPACVHAWMEITRRELTHMYAFVNLVQMHEWTRCICVCLCICMHVWT